MYPITVSTTKCYDITIIWVEHTLFITYKQIVNLILECYKRLRYEQPHKMATEGVSKYSFQRSFNVGIKNTVFGIKVRT